jgi:hypothetical protein
VLLLQIFIGTFQHTVLPLQSFNLSTAEVLVSITRTTHLAAQVLLHPPFLVLLLLLLQSEVEGVDLLLQLRVGFDVLVDLYL